MECLLPSYPDVDADLDLLVGQLRPTAADDCASVVGCLLITKYGPDPLLVREPPPGRMTFRDPCADLSGVWCVIRVLLAEDMHLIRGALIALLDLESDIE